MFSTTATFISTYVFNTSAFKITLNEWAIQDWLADYWLY